MKNFNAKKFLMIGSWLRVETGADHVVNKVSETLASMGFVVEVRKLHV